MASIHRDLRFPKGPWYAAFTLSNGRRVARTTKTTNRKEAQILADAWEQVEKESVRGNLTRDRVMAVLNETLVRIGHTPEQHISVKQWLQEWLAVKKSTLASKSHQAYRHAAQEFLAYLGTGATRSIESISERDIEGFVAHLRKSGRGATTINRMREHLGGGFEKARRMGRIPYNPCGAVEAEKDDSLPRATFDPSAIAALLEVADCDWQGAILFGYSTGARLADVASLRWSNLDVSNGVVTFKEGKTKKKAIIGLHGDFLDWLSESPVPKDPDAFLFPSLAGKSTGGAGGLSVTFISLIEKAGLENPLLRKGDNGKARKLHALSFHSLRHTAATTVFNSAALKEITRRVTQHAAKGSLDRYIHEDLAAIREAVNLIPRLPR